VLTWWRESVRTNATANFLPNVYGSPAVDTALQKRYSLGWFF